MRAREREKLQRKLDAEMKPYRRAGMDFNPTNGLLRAVRTALKVPILEIAERMGVTRSVVFDLEARELSNGASLKSISRMAEAMDCKMVYGIVPKSGLTLEQLAQERLWRRVREKGKSKEQRAGNRDQGLRDQGLRDQGLRDQGLRDQGLRDPGI